MCVTDIWTQILKKISEEDGEEASILVQTIFPSRVFSPWHAAACVGQESASYCYLY